MEFGVVRSIWKFFCPPDPPFLEIFGHNADPLKIEAHMKSIAAWRFKVAVTLAAVVTFGVASLTPWGFVRAGDIDKKIESKVSESVKQTVSEIKNEQAQIKADVASIKYQGVRTEAALNELLKTSTAQTICQLLAKRLRELADKEQERYKALSGEFYPEGRCGGG